MYLHGYGSIPDRAFVAFDRELDEGAWKDVTTADIETAAKQNVAILLTTPLLVGWKLRMRWAIAGIIAALGAPSLNKLDEAWDAAQRRLFHTIAIGVDSDNAATRAAADRLRNQVLSGSGTGQTQLSCDDQVDFGRHQIALTQEGGPLSADAKKLKLGDVLNDVQKTTDALAQALGRTIGEKRKAPSKQIRAAIAECVSVFNAVHNDLEWFVAKTSPGPDRDRFVALLEPLEQLLARNESTSNATPTPETTPQSPATG